MCVCCIYLIFRHEFLFAIVKSQLELFCRCAHTFVSLNPCLDSFHLAHLCFSGFGIFPKSRVLCAEFFFLQLYAFLVDSQVLLELIGTLLNLFELFYCYHMFSVFTFLNLAAKVQKKTHIRKQTSIISKKDRFIYLYMIFNIPLKVWRIFGRNTRSAFRRTPSRTILPLSRGLVRGCCTSHRGDREGSLCPCWIGESIAISSQYIYQTLCHADRSHMPHGYADR